MWYNIFGLLDERVIARIVSMKIGIMGAVGSFSEQAAEQYKRDFLDGPEIEICPLVSAEAVLSAVEVGEIDRGIFPIENSNGGIVIEAVHAMAAHRFSIERMFELDVHHMLLVQPGTKAEAITSITSHDQAIKQCRMYLRRTWPDAAIEVYADTAKAAADLANGSLESTTAVIAPRRCARLYGLDILEESIQDLKFNYTSFLVAVK
jgi:prephenate dehydratase